MRFARLPAPLRTRIACVALAGFAVSGCVVPKDGPTGREVENSAEVRLVDSGRLSYAFVKLSPLTVDKVQTEPQKPVLFSRLTELASPTEAVVGASDTVTITVFEASAGGLFIPTDAGARPGNFIQVPNQEVDQRGDINVPYGGSIRALGRTTRDIAAEIESKLRLRAIEPQVVVAISERNASVVSVLGDVYTPTNIALRPGGLRLLAGVARAGGSRYPGHETIVTLHRKGRTENALLTSIIQDPNQNIQLAPEDVVYVSHQARSYLAFGATPSPGSIGGQNNRRFVFEEENLTLAEAIAKAGGLLSDSADPRAVFLFRYVSRSTLAKAGLDVSQFPTNDVPTVFQVDLSQAQGYFVSNHFYMKHKDIIFISEFPTADLVKFLNIVNTVIAPVSSGAAATSTIRGIK